MSKTIHYAMQAHIDSLENIVRMLMAERASFVVYRNPPPGNLPLPPAKGWPQLRPGDVILSQPGTWNADAPKPVRFANGDISIEPAEAVCILEFYLGFKSELPVVLKDSASLVFGGFNWAVRWRATLDGALHGQDYLLPLGPLSPEVAKYAGIKAAEGLVAKLREEGKLHV